MEPYDVACGNYFSVAAVRTAIGYAVYAWGDNRRGAGGFCAEDAASLFVLTPRRIPGTETKEKLRALSCANDAAVW